MTLEERLQASLGQMAFTLAVLQTQLEQAQTRIAELEKPTDLKRQPAKQDVG